MLVSPRYKGMKGHPVLIRKPLFKEFLGISESETMKTVIERHNDKHLFVEGDEWTVTDLDTKKDYDRIKELWKQKKTGFY
jgi:CTP:molybdopterin cytidylyltransferase MocA